jgi:predicted phage baseplate assembly protein
LRDVVLNGGDAEQETLLTGQWAIAAAATIVGTPVPGTTQPLGIEVDPLTGAITHLDVTAASAPRVAILGYRPPAPDAPGELSAAAERLGTSTGDPGQVFELRPAPVDMASVRVYAGVGSTWRRFHAHQDLVASGPGDAHVVLDAGTGQIICGDGWHGVVPAAGHLLIAEGRSTLAGAGNVPAGTIDRITGDAPAGVTVSQPLAATGGAAAETLGEAEARAEQLTTATTRAMTPADVELLVRATPGSEIARVAVIADLHPAFPCVRAPGVVTVVVIPWLPAARPLPSSGLLRAVATQLAPNRIVGMRFEVTAPRYVAITVVATVAARRAAVPGDVRRQAVEALDVWLHPLSGGAAGTGWPLGRDVGRTEILQVLDDLAGVDHVVALELVGPCGESCGNLCLGRLELPISGAHAITVVRS